MASGTDYHFSLPIAKPILELDDEGYETVFKNSGNSIPKKDYLSRENNQLCSVQDAQKALSPTSSSFVPQSVLVGSLLEQLCSLYEPDPEAAKRLFQSICVQLEKLNFVSSVTYQEEFASIRSQYKASFYSIIHAVRFKTDPIPSLPLQRCDSNYESKLKTLVKQQSSTDKVFRLVPSRYEEEFEELCELGKGAFGMVFRARNRIDRQDYAVKKIHFKDINLNNDPQQVKKIIREVESLAALQHPNVVRYHHSWMEHNLEDTVQQEENGSPYPSSYQKHNSNHSFGNFSPASSSASTELSWADVTEKGGDQSCINSKFWIGQDDDSSGSDSEMNKAPKSSSLNLEIPSGPHSPPNDVILTHGVRRETEMKRVQSVIFGNNIHKLSKKYPFLSSNNNSNNVVRSRSTNSLRDASLVFNGVNPNDVLPQLAVEPQLSPSSITLFIQMQICDSSLQEWLIDRNKLNPGEQTSDILSVIDKQKTFDIYLQLLTALSYIHEKEIMHRDLKPRNIFLNGARPHVLLGDFGLSRPAVSRNSSTEMTPAKDQIMSFDDLEEHTSGVGTTSYAAPEQLAHENYDFKADMYSAGIILFELTWPLQTQHERGNYLRKLREQVIPSEYTQHWKDTSQILQSLVSFDPDKRPSAVELLEKGYFLPKTSNNVSVLTSENEMLKKEIQKLLVKNAHLQLLADKYYSKLKELNIDPDS